MTLPSLSLDDLAQLRRAVSAAIAERGIGEICAESGVAARTVRSFLGGDRITRPTEAKFALWTRRQAPEVSLSPRAAAEVDAELESRPLWVIPGLRVTREEERPPVPIRWSPFGPGVRGSGA